MFSNNKILCKTTIIYSTFNFLFLLNPSLHTTQVAWFIMMTSPIMNHFVLPNKEQLCQSFWQSVKEQTFKAWKIEVVSKWPPPPSCLLGLMKNTQNSGISFSKILYRELQRKYREMLRLPPLPPSPSHFIIYNHVIFKTQKH